MDILSKIVEEKKEEVSMAKARVSEGDLRSAASEVSKPRAFYDTMAKPGHSGTNIIAEIKRASPSKGLMHPDLDPELCAKKYEAGGAAALSILTDGPNFRGSAEDLKTAKNAVSLPVLRKDFIISTYQIYDSKVMGADAILLITRVLSEQQLGEFLNLAHELDMAALVEVHTESDIEKANSIGAKLVGINNRNLRSFETNIQTAIKMVGFLKSSQIYQMYERLKFLGD